MPKCEYIELHTPDIDKAKEFYGGLFGWNFNEMPGAEPYFYATDGENGVGGVVGNHPGEAPRWLPYVTVDDIAATVTEAKGLGAEILFEKTEVPTMGWFAVLKDPTGADLALWQNA